MNYNEIQALNQSLLKKIYDPELFKSLLDGHREEATPEQSLGSYVDAYIFDHDNLNNRFTILDSSVPTGQMGDFTEFLVRTYMQSKDAYFDFNAAAEAAYNHAGFKRDKFDTVLERFKTEGEPYFKAIQQAVDTGSQTITQDMVERGKKVVLGITKNDLARRLLIDKQEGVDSSSQVQLEGLLELNEDVKIPIKGILDRLVIDRNTETVHIIDLKTTSSSLHSYCYRKDPLFENQGWTGFIGDAFKYDYFFQLYFYSILVEKNSEKFQLNSQYKIKHYLVAAHTYNYNCKVYDVSLPVQSAGRSKYLELMRRYLWHSENGFDKVFGETDNVIWIG